MHIIFYIKMDGNFTIKSILVAGGHTTAPSSSITYSSVVHRERIWISFVLESLDDLEIFTYEIDSTYINANFS